MDDNYVGRDDSCACPNSLMLNVEDHMSGAQGSYFYRQFVFLTTVAFAHGETQTLFNSPARRWFCCLAQMTTFSLRIFQEGNLCHEFDSCYIDVRDTDDDIKVCCF